MKKVGMSFGATPLARRPAPAAEPTQEVLAPQTGSVPAHLHRDRRGELLATVHKDCRSRGEFIGEISRLWNEAQHRFLEIGRYLCEAKERLGHGEFMPMIETDLPFGYKVAVKLMAVSKAVDDGVFPRDRLPPSYSTVYELISLKSEDRQRAMAENIVRPDVSREEVLRFKRRLRETGSPPPAADAKTLRKRLDRLLADRQALDRQISELERQLQDTIAAEARH